jgi:hypothetical protein
MVEGRAKGEVGVNVAASLLPGGLNGANGGYE